MEEQNQDNNRLEKLQKEIYGRTFESPTPPVRQHFSEQQAPVESGWQHEEQPQRIEPPTDADLKPKKKSFFKKILIAVIIFFVLSAGVLAYMFFAGWNVVSANNVSISFNGPITVAAGTNLDLGIDVKNLNNSGIENATLYIDYPDGTKKAEDITEDLLHETRVVGEIPTRASTTTIAHAILFGELNAKRQIKVTLEYGLKNLNATYKKSETYEVMISSTPVTIVVDHQPQAITNTQVDFDMGVTSNSSAPLTNLLVKVDYPFGFSFTQADPAPSFESSYWLIPLLKPGEKKNIHISGAIQGEQNDERVFHFSIGAQDPHNPKIIATRYLTQAESVIVQKPPLSIKMTLNGSSTPTIATVQGSSIQGTIEIVNNLTTRIVDPQVQVTFGGQLYDASSVRSGLGFFQSNTNSITWNKSNIPNFVSLDPGQKMTFTFSFSTYPTSRVSVKNGTMDVKATVQGNQNDTSNSSQTLSSSVASKVQTKTAIGILSRLVYASGTFRNRGPIPPKVGSKTTYTVIWTATNSSNDVRGAEVHATLPSYVHWLSAVNPASESVTWNPDKNEVVWRLGDLVAGTGAGKQAREVSFQIEFQPSLSQVADSPTLLMDTGMTATDSFTNETLSATANNLTTRLSSEPQYSGDEALVTK